MINKSAISRRILFLIFCFLLLIDTVLALIYYFSIASFDLTSLGSKNTITNQQYSSILSKAKTNAIAASQITLTNCKPDLAILKARKTDTIMINNADDKTHHLTFSQTTKLTIDAHQTKALKLDFISFVPSVNGYYCDNIRESVGTFYVE